MTTTEKPTNVDLADIEWYHLDGTVCVAGFYAEGPEYGFCAAGGGPITPSPHAKRWLLEQVKEATERVMAELVGWRIP